MEAVFDCPIRTEFLGVSKEVKEECLMWTIIYLSVCDVEIATKPSLGF
jgi:hypothetical protein